MFKNFKKWLSTALHIDGFLSLLRNGAVLYSAGAAYLLTLLETYQKLSKVDQWLYLSAFYLIILYSILGTVYSVNKLRQYWNSRVRKDIGVSISWGKPVSMKDISRDNTSSQWAIFFSDKMKLGDDWYCHPVGGAAGNNSNLKEDCFLPKLSITNHSNNPIFRVEIPANTVIGQRLDHNQYQPLVNYDYKIYLSMKQHLDPGETIDVYLAFIASEKYIAAIDLLGYIEGEIFGIDNPVKIKYTWEGFKPLKIDLIGCQNLDVHGE